jgi:hypothetical protein
LTGVIEVSREARRAAGLALALALAAAPSAAQHGADTPSDAPSTSEDSTGSSDEGTFLGEAPLAPLPITEAFRIRLQTFVAPEAPLGSGDVTLVRPELNARATWPINDRVVLRMTMRLSESRYRFHGDAWGSAALLPGVGKDPDEAVGNLDLYAAQLGLEGAYGLSRDTNWLAQHEEWAVIGALYGGSGWEDGAFRSGLGARGVIGIGYEIPERLRLALGVSLRTPLDHAGVDVGPFLSLRWRPVDRFTLRTRELGLQAEFALTPVFEIYLAGFRATDRFALNNRSPLGDLTFRDRRVQVGAGFEYKLANWVRIALEGGSIVDRRIRVEDEDLGTLLSRRGDPSGYCEVRVELRL